jgi:hypothetical protein
MTILNRKALKKIILKEFRMMGMGNLGAIGNMPMGMTPVDSYENDYNEAHGVEEDKIVSPAEHAENSNGSVSREDCCEAVKCLIECCACSVTKQALIDCCNDILSGQYDC